MRTEKASVVWNPKTSEADRRLLFGIKLTFWAIILIGMALAVRKFFWC